MDGIGDSELGWASTYVKEVDTCRYVQDTPIGQPKLEFIYT